MAGLYGDGLVAGANLFKKQAKLRSSWENGVRESGKDPRRQAVVLEHWAAIGEKDDREVRQAAVKWRFEPKTWERGYRDNTNPEEIEARVDNEIPLEETLKDLVARRSPEDHASAIKELYDLRATHVLVHVATPNQKEVINYLGSKVLRILRE